MGKRVRKFGKTGCLFWLLILVVIVVIILYRGKGSFREAFKSIGKGLRREVAEVEEPEDIAEKDEDVVIVEEEKDEEKQVPTEEIIPEKETKEAEKVTPVPEKKEEKQKAEETIRPKKLDATLYFVKINQTDGSAKPIPVKRTVEYLDSPITRTFNTLLRGSSQTETEKGIVSFIPENTKLLGAEIINGHLTLNFSSQLEDNYSGRDAILLELSQIMLTAFDFEQVKKVSILIDGQRRSYITGEGIPLKKVYIREDISQLYSGG
ncbi:MAG: GerMN domain-containing protein [Spirochaetota bacterium]|nr:MAG: GerMN domain-containing protein [Spirochaetota bacterium]